MPYQVTHVIVHDDDQVRDIIRAATRIADDAAQGSHTWEIVFREACRLLGQRWTFAAQPEPVNLAALKLPGAMHG